MEYVVSYLRTPFYGHFAILNFGTLCQLFAKFNFVKLRFQHLHGFFPIVELASGFAVVNYYPGRVVGKNSLSFYLVYVLSPSATTSGEIPRNIGRIYFNLNSIVYKWIYIYTYKTSMAFGVAVKRGDAHQSMHSVFTFEPPEGKFALNFQGDGFYACHISRLKVEFFYFIAVFLRPH